jgi:hypothetical protein
LCGGAKHTHYPGSDCSRREEPHQTHYSFELLALPIYRTLIVALLEYADVPAPLYAWTR